MNLKDLKPNAKNPRRIRDNQLDKLAESIKRDPEYMVARPIIVNTAMMILGGHQRYRACLKLGYTEIPDVWVRVVDWDAEKAKRFSLVDNSIPGMTGEFDIPALLQEFDLPDLEELGFSKADLGIFDTANDAAAEWQGMPEFANEDKTAYRTIPVHFNTDDDVAKFAALIGQKITDKTRFVWYPAVERSKLDDKRYK